MQITDIRIRKVEKEGKMKAVVSITIDDVFVVHDIKVIDGEKGLFIAKLAMENIAILHIQSIQRQEKAFRSRFWNATRKRKRLGRLQRRKSF